MFLVLPWIPCKCDLNLPLVGCPLVGAAKRLELSWEASTCTIVGWCILICVYLCRCLLAKYDQIMLTPRCLHADFNHVVWFLPGTTIPIEWICLGDGNRQQDQFSIVEDGWNIPPIGPDKVLVFTNTNEQNHDKTKRKYDLMMLIFPKKSGLVFSTVDLSFGWGNSEIRIMLVIEALLVVESPSKDWRSNTASSWNRTAPGRHLVE